MGKKYADVIVDISHEQVDRPFQYEIPERMRDTLDYGMCVEIPFGNGNKIIKGYVVGLSDKCNWNPAKMKAIHRIVVDSTVAQDRQIQLAAWIKKNYGATMIQAIKTVIPARKSV